MVEDYYLLCTYVPTTLSRDDAMFTSVQPSWKWLAYSSTDLIYFEVILLFFTFSGRCENGNPCAQNCYNIHNEMYECECHHDFVLSDNGYSCIGKHVFVIRYAHLDATVLVCFLDVKDVTYMININMVWHCLVVNIVTYFFSKFEVFWWQIVQTFKASLDLIFAPNHLKFCKSIADFQPQNFYFEKSCF